MGVQLLVEFKERSLHLGLASARLHLATLVASCSVTALENMKGEPLRKGITHFIKVSPLSLGYTILKIYYTQIDIYYRANSKQIYIILYT